MRDARHRADTARARGRLDRGMDRGANGLPGTDAALANCPSGRFSFQESRRVARSCSSWAARSRSPAIRNTISRIKSPSAQPTSARSNQLESSTHHSPEAWDQRQQKKSPPKRAVPPLPFAGATNNSHPATRGLDGLCYWLVGGSLRPAANDSIHSLSSALARSDEVGVMPIRRHVKR